MPILLRSLDELEGTLLPVESQQHQQHQQHQHLPTNHDRRNNNTKKSLLYSSSSPSAAAAAAAAGDTAALLLPRYNDTMKPLEIDDQHDDHNDNIYNDVSLANGASADVADNDDNEFQDVPLIPYDIIHPSDHNDRSLRNRQRGSARSGRCYTHQDVVVVVAKASRMGAVKAEFDREATEKATREMIGKTHYHKFQIQQANHNSSSIKALTVAEKQTRIPGPVVANNNRRSDNNNNSSSSITTQSRQVRSNNDVQPLLMVVDHHDANDDDADDDSPLDQHHAVAAGAGAAESEDATTTRTTTMMTNRESSSTTPQCYNVVGSSSSSSSTFQRYDADRVAIQVVVLIQRASRIGILKEEMIYEAVEKATRDMRARTHHAKLLIMEADRLAKQQQQSRTTTTTGTGVGGHDGHNPESLITSLSARRSNDIQPLLMLMEYRDDDDDADVDCETQNDDNNNNHNNNNDSSLWIHPQCGGGDGGGDNVFGKISINRPDQITYALVGANRQGSVKGELDRDAVEKANRDMRAKTKRDKTLVNKANSIASLKKKQQQLQQHDHRQLQQQQQQQQLRSKSESQLLMDNSTHSINVIV